ncbi:hypothetical protein FIBSPDRAFT_879996 [Athelia psychrophila]|uniref:Secreted protein n=1 Tax=Athelia psychrophila TaxID=1759441 RepID=A0A167TDL9_9AGAM|nr:hypothetical protein FIBSPDRAFT_879996 [Fibularhizoctonia sp. CBS 109695]
MCSRCVSILSSLLFPLPLVISPFGLALLHPPTKNSMLIQIVTAHVTTWTTFSGMHTEEGGIQSAWQWDITCAVETMTDTVGMSLLMMMNSGGA